MASSDSVRELRLTVPLDWQALEPARAAVIAHLAPAGLDARSLYAVELVLEEMLTNIIRHARPAADAGPVRLDVVARAGRVRLRFDYAGMPFDPSTAPARQPARDLDDPVVGGRGLPLMRHHASRVAYERHGERNRVTLDIASGGAPRG